MRRPSPPRPLHSIPGDQGQLDFAVGYVAFDDAKVIEEYRARLCSPIGANLDGLDTRSKNCPRKNSGAMNMTSVHRFISLFRETDELSEREIEFLIQPTLAQLQEIFGMDQDNRMYDEFEINPPIAADLAQFTKHSFDFNNHSYFLSCTSS